MSRRSQSLLFCFILAFLLQFVNNWCLKSQFSDTQKINSIDFSRDGSKIVTASNSDRVIVWDARTLQQLWVYNVTVNANSAKFSKDNSMIAVGAAQNNIIILRADGTVVTTTLASSQTSVYEVDFNENTTRLISCGQTFMTNIYTISGQTFTFQGNSGNRLNQNMCCRLSRNLDIVAMGNKIGSSYILNFNSTGFTTSFLRTGTLIQRAVDWNDITNQAYFGGTDQRLYIISKDGIVDRNIPIGKQIYTVSVSQDGQYAAVGGKDGPLYMYNVAINGSQSQQQILSQSQIDLSASAFSPDSQYLVTGNNNGTMFMYKRICSGCPSGSYSNGSICRPCNADIAGCYLCQNSTYCYSCTNGYYLNVSANSTVSSKLLCVLCYVKLTGCIQCLNDSFCITCFQGYYLDAGVTNICKSCWNSMIGCLSCNSSNYCYICSYKYFLNSSTNNCQSCTKVLNCLQCNSSSYCLECVQGYYENGFGGCLICQSNCSYCINGTFCTQCDNGFILSNGSCSLCTVTGCQYCNSSNYCLDCIDSMWENAGICTYCTTPCYKCSSNATTCLTCIAGYYLSGSNCNVCSNITQGCTTCKGSLPADCLSCVKGYYLISGNLCSRCTNLVTNCSQCNSTTCLSCRLGLYYDSVNVSCKICAQGCLTCLSFNICLSCQVGFFYNFTTSQCTFCPQQCASCESITICYSCNPMYYYNSTNLNCSKCSILNCVTCKNNSVCLTCLQGYFMDSSGTVCRACNVNISRCLSCDNQSYCKSCQLGFYLASNNSSCIQCASPCSTCDSNDCFTCEFGYYLTNLTNTSAKFCQICTKQCSQCVTSSNCSKCISGYYLNSTTNSCNICQNLKTGCLLCNQTQCFSCRLEMGYFFNSSDNSCYACANQIIRCKTCSNSSYCNLCQYGYTFQFGNFTCSSCFSLISNCQNCINFTKCQTCIKGYYVDSNSTCQSCMKGCSTCNNSASCQICLRQYIIQSNSTCTLCQQRIMGCQICKYNSTNIQCQNCITGFYLNATTCIICSSAMQGCFICNDSTTCLSCISGYYLNVTTNKCIICDSTVPKCQLCKYNISSILFECLDCNSGYFLNLSSNLCFLCTDFACLRCSDNITCTRCQTGFYQQAGNCISCLNVSLGCRICNNSYCIQCSSGYFLNSSGKCQACYQQGCQICSKLNPATKCLACNSHYYLTSLESCQLCNNNISNCIQCANSTICQVCQSGYFIRPSGNCDICSLKYNGCTLCTSSVCLQCQPGYILNATDLCQLCQEFIPGCSFCLSQTNCVSCQSGFFAQNNTCYLCTSINGCLQCVNSSQCIFCDYGFYLQNGTCLNCSLAISNCISCDSSVYCTACLGNFMLSAGACAQIKGQSFIEYTDIELITEYVSQSQLKHTLKSIGRKIHSVDLNWTVQSKFYLIDQSYDQYTLTILRTQFGQKGFSLIVYTDNPLSNLSNLNNLNSMPLLSSSIFQKRRRFLLDSFSFDNKFKTKMQMSEQGFNSLFPDVHHKGSFFMKYKLSQPQFYKSVITRKKYNYQYFGFIVSIFLLILYFLKSLMLVPQSEDKGQIIPHILCYKMMGFIIYPLYGQYLSYCKGFTLLDIPWLNDYLSILLTIDTDQSPDTYKLFYYNLNIPSTYLLALIVIVMIYYLGIAITGYLLQNPRKLESFKQYLQNIFICGIVIFSFLSLQGAYYNPVNSFSLNSLFYILGIAIFITLVANTVKSLYKSIKQLNTNPKAIIPLHKPRIILKCVLLSIVYLNPLYIFLSLILMEVCMITTQYSFKKQNKLAPKIWLFNNILVNTGLCFMMFGPSSLISLYLASAFIIIAISIDIYIMILQINDNQKIEKVKLQQNQLIKTMQYLQRQNNSARSKNHQIYFKNKILQQSQNGNEQTNFNQTKNSFNNQPLYFQQEEFKPKPQFETMPITQEQRQQEQVSNAVQNKGKQYVKTRVRTVKPHLKYRKKQQNTGWNVQVNKKEGTFVLGQFQ